MDSLKLLSQILTKAENAKLVEHFCIAGVKFLIGGGTAMAIYGCREVSEVDDLDIVVSPTIENAQRIFSALTAAQFRLSIPPESLAKQAVQLPIKNFQYWAEILTPRKGFDFEEMLSASLAVPFRSMTLHIASRDDLLKMKEDAVFEISRTLAKHQNDLVCLRTT